MQVLTMTRKKTRKPVQNVAGKPSQKAEGTETISGGSNRWVAPVITTAKIREIEENSLLKEPLNNLINLIFRGFAQVTVYTPDGETDDDLSNEAARRYRDLDLYTAHQQAFYDHCLGGCGVFSYGFGDDGKEQFLHMPWWSFSDAPAGFTDVYNEIMPGIVVDPSTRKTRVFQKQSESMATPVEIVNHCIIRDPASPAPAGRPVCLPIVPIIWNYNYAIKVIQQKLNRIGSPVVIPLADITKLNKTFWEEFAKKWGKDTAFVLPKGTEFAEMKITESRVAEEYVSWLKKQAIDFWNPATFVTKEGNAIGASDSGAMELIYNYIDRTLSMLENQICRATLERWLEADGYLAQGYRVEIRHPRPSVSKDEQIRAEVDILAKYGWITANEARQSLPNTDLGELSPEDEAALQSAQMARQQASNPFGSFPVGNVRTPAERTDAMSDTERALIASTRQCAEDVKRIVREKYPKKE